MSESFLNNRIQITPEVTKGVTEFVNKVIKESNSGDDNSSERQLTVEEELAKMNKNVEFLLSTAENTLKEREKDMNAQYTLVAKQLYPNLRVAFEKEISESKNRRTRYTEKLNQLKKELSLPLLEDEKVEKIKDFRSTFLTEEFFTVKDDKDTFDDQMESIDHLDSLNTQIPGLLSKNYPTETYKKAFDSYLSFTNTRKEKSEALMKGFADLNSIGKGISLSNPAIPLTEADVSTLMTRTLQSVESSAEKSLESIRKDPSFFDTLYSNFQNNIITLFPKEKDLIHTSLMKDIKGFLQRMTKQKVTDQEVAVLFSKTTIGFSDHVTPETKISIGETPEQNVSIDSKIDKYTIYMGNGSKVDGKMLITLKQELTLHKTDIPELRDALDQKSIMRFVNYIPDIQKEKADLTSNLRNLLQDRKSTGSALMLRYRISGEDKIVMVPVNREGKILRE